MAKPSVRLSMWAQKRSQCGAVYEQHYRIVDQREHLKPEELFFRTIQQCWTK